MGRCCGGRRRADAGSSLTRSVGARVMLCDGALVAYLRRGNPNVQVFLPEEEPAAVAGGAERWRSSWWRGCRSRTSRGMRGAGMLIASVNGVAVAEHWMARLLLDAGFVAGAMGFNVRRGLPPLPGRGVEVRANA